LAHYDIIQSVSSCIVTPSNIIGKRSIDEDIARAYKTFFKLIKTDVTQYKANPELVQNMDEDNPDYGDILICKRCGGYYKLEQGESIDDFECCHCGGELKQIHNERNV